MHCIALWAKCDSIFLLVTIDFQKSTTFKTFKTVACRALMPIWRDKTKPSLISVSDTHTHTHTHTQRQSNYCSPRACALRVNNRSEQLI